MLAQRLFFTAIHIAAYKLRQVSYREERQPRTTIAEKQTNRNTLPPLVTHHSVSGITPPSVPEIDDAQGPHLQVDFAHAHEVASKELFSQQCL